MRFVVRRLLAMIPTLWVVATITFFMIRLAPGGPFQSEREIPAEAKAALEQAQAVFGRDLPLVPLFFDKATYAHSQRVANVKVDALFFTRLEEIELVAEEAGGP